MSIDQQFMSPEEQKKAFLNAIANHLLSTDQGQSTDVPDTQAQQGVSPDAPSQTAGVQPDNNIDFNTLQSLIKHAANPSAVPMQEGDKVHPMDAIAQISQQMMGPAKPSGIEKTGGPQLQVGTNGQLTANLPSSGSPVANLLGMLGKKQSLPVNAPNYYPTLQAMGADKLLPSGLARMPDGTPFVGPDAAAKAMQAFKDTQSPSNPAYTKEQSMLLFPNQAKKIASAFANMPEGSMLPLTTIRAMTGETMAGARTSMAATAQNKLESGLNSQFAKAISDAEQNQSSPMGISSNILGQAFALRQGIATRYDPQTDSYNLNKGEVGDLMLGTARMLVRKGQLTNEQLDAVKQETAAGKIGNAAQYIFGTSFNGNTQDMIRRSLQLVDKEGLANEQLRNMYARQNLSIGEPLRQMNPALYNKTLANSFGGVNYSQLLSDSPDTNSPNYLVPNIVPVQQSSPIPALTQTSPRGLPAPTGAQPGKVRVRNAQGQTGWINANDPNIGNYTRL